MIHRILNAQLWAAKPRFSGINGLLADTNTISKTAQQTPEQEQSTFAPAALLPTYFGVQASNIPAHHVRRAKTLSASQLHFGANLAIPRPKRRDAETFYLPTTKGTKAIHRFPGDPNHLGATYVKQGMLEGVNFAVASQGASLVELCLFNQPAGSHSQPQEIPQRIPLIQANGVWHGFFPELRPGQIYGFRAHGAYNPSHGQRFNENKLLLDPYAKAIARPSEQWDSSLLGYQNQQPNDPTQKSTRDSATYADLGVVINDKFDWRQDGHPKIPLNNSVIYEAHVKGLTALNPLVPKELRGTYKGLAHPAVIQHLKDLGVTAVELLPIQYHRKDMDGLGRKNYWGYNTLGFFAPQPDYAYNKSPDGPVREFKEMVKTLHQNKLEVFLDVVYNHTAEGDHRGPTLAMRGLDNQSYYRGVPGMPQNYNDFSGCGNTLDTTNPTVIKMIIDSLRYWVDEMHVDGFRFDLASALARDSHGQIPGNMMDHPLIQAISKDPVLSKVKLIAEPWDTGGDGYKVGGFPKGWSEWNGRYRDNVRKYWRGDTDKNDQGKTPLAEFATRLTGSSDLYTANNRGPQASVNFVTAHDGFTLRDLVSYNRKHNEKNGEDNRDGENSNHSYNFGVEGETGKAEIQALRKRQIKNFLTTMMFSQGVPMIVAGDEMGRTQGGNNNAYCQDNEISWLDWENADPELMKHAKTVTQLRKEHPIFRRTAFFNQIPSPTGRQDITWINGNGKEMQGRHWGDPYNQSIGLLYDGDAPGKPGKDNKHFLLLSNASGLGFPFKLPAHPEGKTWQMEFDTARPNAKGNYQAGKDYPMESKSMVLLSMPNPD